MPPKAFEPAFSTSCFPVADRYEGLLVARDVGFRFCEVVLSADDVRERRLGYWADLLEKAAVECWSMHTPFGQDADLANPDPEERERALGLVLEAIEIGGRLGARAAIVHGGAEPVPAERREEHLEAARRSLEDIAAKCGNLGLVMALEFLPRTCPGNSVTELAWLLDGLSNVGVCLDLNHANLNQDLVENIRALSGRIITLHISDNDGVDERHWLPGQGVIPWPAAIAALRKVDYRGPFLYEASRGRTGATIAPQALADNYRDLILPLCQCQ